nr:uncharacterized protein LOC113740596 [Coffea arabica]
MDITRTPPHSKNSGRKKLLVPYFFFRRSCFFFLIFVLSIVFMLGLAAIIIFFVLKPQKPLFSVETAKIESYKLDVVSNKDLFVSSSLSLTLNAANPNRVGISYSTSRLHVLEYGMVIGMIKVPPLHQPPRSQNVSVQAKVILECVNISEITSGKSMQEGSRNATSISQIRLLGDIRAQVRILHVTLPKLRIALDCDIKIDPKHLTFNRDMIMISSIKDGKVATDVISLPTVSQLFSNKCSLALYI